MYGCGGGEYVGWFVGQGVIDLFGVQFIQEMFDWCGYVVEVGWVVEQQVLVFDQVLYVYVGGVIVGYWWLCGLGYCGYWWYCVQVCGYVWYFVDVLCDLVCQLCY